MSSTNKTPNYELSQYVGTDKPTYLGDYNGDMLKIDAQMKANADAASNAEASAGEAVAKVSTVDNTVSAIDTRLKTAEGTIQSQGQTLTQLNANVVTLTSDNTTNKQNITNLQNSLGDFAWVNLPITGTYASKYKVYYNKGANLLNIFGNSGASGGDARSVLFNITNFNPSEDHEIISGLAVVIASTGLQEITASFYIKQNGDVVFNDKSVDLPYENYGCKINVMLNTSQWGVNR